MVISHVMIIADLALCLNAIFGAILHKFEGNGSIFLYNKQNTPNTWMLGNMKLISCVDKDISLVRFTYSWDILVNTQNKFNISAHPFIILYLYST
jgi:hypothetical protein